MNLQDANDIDFIKNRNKDIMWNLEIRSLAVRDINGYGALLKFQSIELFTENDNNNINDLSVINFGDVSSHKIITDNVEPLPKLEESVEAQMSQQIQNKNNPIPKPKSYKDAIINTIGGVFGFGSNDNKTEKEAELLHKEISAREVTTSSVETAKKMLQSLLNSTKLIPKLTVLKKK
jgi:hypothetical protein